MFKNIPENIRLALNSILPLVVVLILFVIVGRFGFAKISEVGDQVAASQKDQAVLTQKLELLSTLGETAAAGSQLTAGALPDTNPALIVISQLKGIAGQSGIVIANVKAGAEAKDSSGLSRVDISFEAMGPRAQIIAFAKSVDQIAPITLVDKIKIAESAGAARATISVRSFWAEFPTKLPALTEAISDLTNDERNILGSISNLTQPQFIEVPPSQGASRPDPFTQ